MLRAPTSRVALFTVLLAAAMPVTTACSADDSWRASVDQVITALMAGSVNHTTADLDPFGTAPDRAEIIGQGRVGAPAAVLVSRLSDAARAADWDEPSCVTIDRAAARAILAEKDDNQPNIPSYSCTLTVDGDPYGQVVIAAYAAGTADLMYDLGPEATGFARSK